MQRKFGAMIFKFVTRVREITRVLRGLSPDEVVRQRTIAINEQIVRVSSPLSLLEGLRACQPIASNSRELRKFQSVGKVEVDYARPALSVSCGSVGGPMLTIAHTPRFSWKYM